MVQIEKNRRRIMWTNLRSKKVNGRTRKVCPRAREACDNKVERDLHVLSGQITQISKNNSGSRQYTKCPSSTRKETSATYYYVARFI